MKGLRTADSGVLDARGAGIVTALINGTGGGRSERFVATAASPPPPIVDISEITDTLPRCESGTVKVSSTSKRLLELAYRRAEVGGYSREKMQ